MISIPHSNTFRNYLEQGFDIVSVTPRINAADENGFGYEYRMIALKTTNRLVSFFNLSLLFNNFSSWKNSVVKGKRIVCHIASSEFFARSLQYTSKKEEIARNVLKATAAIFRPDEIASQKKELCEKLSGNEGITEELINKISYLSAEDHCILYILAKSLKDAESYGSFDHQYFSSSTYTNDFIVYLNYEDTDEGCSLGGNTLPIAKKELEAVVHALVPHALLTENTQEQ